MCWPFRGGDSDSPGPARGRMCDARVSGAPRLRPGPLESPLGQLLWGSEATRALTLAEVPFFLDPEIRG